MTTLADLAHVLRSKNSGPFELTLDILFTDPAAYRRVLNSGVITKARVAALYSLPPEAIRVLAHFDAALGIKVTMLREIPSGTAGDRDVYGAQQHAPLLGLVIPDATEKEASQ